MSLRCYDNFEVNNDTAQRNSKWEVAVVNSYIIKRCGWAVDMRIELPYYSINRPGRLLNLLDLESGRLFEAGRLLNFQHFQQV